MSRKHIYGTIVLATLTACKNNRNATSNTAFQELGEGAEGLAKLAANPQVSICLQGNSGNRGSEVKQIVDSYYSGIISGVPNMSAPNVIVIAGSNCDATVIFAPVNPAYTDVGAAPTVHIGDNTQEWFGSRGVLVHEFGHAFGLADTYNQSSRQAGDCVGANPKEAAMCSPFYEVPQLDDVNGVRSVYQRITSNYSGQPLSQINPGNSNNNIGADPNTYKNLPPSIYPNSNQTIPPANNGNISVQPLLPRPSPRCPPQVIAGIKPTGTLSILTPEAVNSLSVCLAGIMVCQDPHAVQPNGRTFASRFILQNVNPQQTIGPVFPYNTTSFAQLEYSSGTLTAADRASVQNGIVTLQGLTRSNQLFMCELPVTGL